jgi:hypothetical protein
LIGLNAHAWKAQVTAHSHEDRRKYMAIVDHAAE